MRITLGEAFRPVFKFVLAHQTASLKSYPLNPEPLNLFNFILVDFHSTLC
jgi:hypothetical protein